MASTAMLPGLEAPPPVGRWDGSTLPAIFDGERTCGRCGWGTVVRFPPATQDALFFHGGYGASERRTVEVCLACGGSAEVGVETMRPPRG